MQADRLTSAMLVGVLVRRAAAAGGFATVLVKGDEISGVVLVEAAEKGQFKGLFERVSDFEGGYRLERCGPAVEEDQLLHASILPDRAGQRDRRRARTRCRRGITP